MKAILNTIPIGLRNDYKKAKSLRHWNMIDSGDYNVDRTRDARLCVKYLQDLHIFHGFESILFPESIESSLPRKICNLEFVEFCPDIFWEMGRTRKNRIYRALADILMDELTQDLNEEERSYALPFGFDFGTTLEVYSKWETAVELEACLVFPTYTTLWLASLTLHEPEWKGNPKVSEARKTLGNWFFSHVPDSSTLIPSFKKRIEQNIFKKLCELEETSEMHTYREKLARAWYKGAVTLRNLIEEMPLKGERVKQAIIKQWENVAVFSTSISIAAYTRDIINLLPSLITIPSLGKEIIRTVRRKDFDSPFCMEPWRRCPLPEFTSYSEHFRPRIAIKSQEGLQLQKIFLGIQFNKYLFCQQYLDLFDRYNGFLYVQRTRDDVGRSSNES